MNKSIPEEALEQTKAATVLMSNVPLGMTAEITVRKQNHKPSFEMHGSGKGSIDKGTNSMNYTKMLLGLSKPAAFTFDKIMDGRLPEIDDTGIQHQFKMSNTSHVSTKGLTAMHKKYITQGYKELLDKDMVVRQKRGIYIVNPRLVISGDKWAQELATYDKVKSKLNEEK